METLLSAVRFISFNACINMKDLIATIACTFSQMYVPKVSNNLLRPCREHYLRCNSVYSAVLSRIRDPSVSDSCTQSWVGAGVLCIPCLPPLISDRLFGISSLHQLDPLTDNLLPREGWGLPGCRTKKGGGMLLVVPPPLFTLSSKTPLQTTI